LFFHSYDLVQRDGFSYATLPYDRDSKIRELLHWISTISLVRNNQDKNLGALAELPDLNVSISRAKKKLIIIGSFEMMADGHGDRRRSKTNYARNLAKLV
jgi:AAA domain